LEEGSWSGERRRLMRPFREGRGRATGASRCSGARRRWLEPGGDSVCSISRRKASVGLGLLGQEADWARKLAGLDGAKEKERRNRKWIGLMGRKRILGQIP
jgi:hypothetical protein